MEDSKKPEMNEDKLDEREHDLDEPNIEDFLFDEEDEDKKTKSKIKSISAKVIAFAIAFSLVVSVLAVWVRVFNIPSFSFLEKSNELSKIENIQDYKKAVVTIEGNGSKGTGFNISEEGTIVTNHHVIENMLPITVIFPNGDLFQAEITEEYPELDIALLKIDGNELPYLEIQREEEWGRGNSTYVIGNPLAYNQIVMEGIITKDGQTMHLSAPIEKGNSGSPVIDMEGKVIGVVYAMTIPTLGSEEDPEGLAVPVERIPVLQ
ncbi:S1C family serine protease [Bacillus sp. AK031]